MSFVSEVVVTVGNGKRSFMSFGPYLYWVPVRTGQVFQVIYSEYVRLNIQLTDDGQTPTD